MTLVQIWERWRGNPASKRPKLAEAYNVPRDLNDALAAESNCWSPEAQARIRERLACVAAGEWAQATLDAWDRGPDAFLLRHFQADLEHAQTAIALYRAVGEVTTRTGTESLHEALAQLGISEADWLRQSGLALFDRDDGISTIKEQTP